MAEQNTGRRNSAKIIYVTLLSVFAVMTTIRFNHRNEWGFDKGYPLVYKFGFADWNFDRNGFPYSVAKLRWYPGVHTRDD